jgi:hypothetical protein
MIRDRVLNENPELVTAVAKGYRRGGRTVIPSNMLQDENSLRSALLNELDRFPKEVIAAFRNPDVVMIGRVQHAMDKGIIVFKDIGNFIRAWAWSPEHGGEDITETSGPDHITQFLAKMTTSGKRVTLLAQIDAALNKGKKKSEKVESEKLHNVIQEQLEDPTDPLGLVNRAVEAGVVVYMPSDRKCYILNENEQIVGKALKKINNTENWKYELSQGSKLVINRIKKALEVYANANV